MMYGIVPDDLKIAKIIPIYKCDDKKIISNYRPISVLPVFSKILERLIYNRLLNFIDQQCILSRSQYGFRKNISTAMALVDLIDKISSSIEKNEYTIGIFIDLAKAFDT
jgi:Reverse transcriptase (RNA-dependent DNA polymerase)